jgi:hypothetical protein
VASFEAALLNLAVVDDHTPELLDERLGFFVEDL